METNDIERLLARYYDGTTSEEEEKILLDFFRDGDVPGNLKNDCDVFLALHDVGAPIKTPEGIEERIATMIGLQPSPVWRQPKVAVNRLVRLCGMAASVLAVGMLGIYLHGRKVLTPQEKATIAQAQTALVEFSSALNKGLEQMEAAHEKTQEISESINKCIKLNNTEDK